MHQGTFPPLDPPLAAPSDAAAVYQPGSWSPEELDPPAKGGSSRRQWLAGVGGVFAGASLTVGWSRLATAGAGPAPAQGADEGPPAWALELVDAPSDEVIQWSGDLDRIVGRFPDDQRLVPSCERVLEVVLEERATTPARREALDVAGSAAVRALSRLGREDLVTMRSRRILSRRDLVQTGEAAERLLVDRRPPEARK